MTDAEFSNEPSRKEMDVFLMWYVSATDKGVIDSIPISVLMNGMVVSGILISKKAYLTAISSDLSEERIDELTESQEFPEYFHLRDAKCFTGGHPIPSNAGVFFRGRLAHASGFWLSNLQSG